MDSPSDAEVIGRSLDEPEAFGLVYDRHAATVLRFLGRRVGAEAAEGLLGELFRIAFERRKTFDAARESALPTLMRFTPIADKSARLNRTPCKPMITFTGRSTELTTAAMSCWNATSATAAAMRAETSRIVPSVG